MTPDLPGVAADDDPSSDRPSLLRRKWFWAVATSVLVGLALVAEVASGSHISQPPGPRAAPAFRLPEVARPTAMVALSDANGRPAVVNFWASWCIPCRKEMPALEQAHRQLGSKVAFIGIDHEDARGDALAFLRQTGVTYPSGFDPTGKTAAKYALLGLPTTIVVSPAGRIVWRHTGAVTLSQLEAEIARQFPDIHPPR